MKKDIRILLVEDNAFDAELIMAELKNYGLSVTMTRVEDEDSYLEQLERNWDVILSDYNLPQFTGKRALALLTEKKCEIPFIVVSGAITPEAAVEMIREGATDYLFKESLLRLGSAVVNTIERSESAQKSKLNEKLYQNIVHTAMDGIIVTDERGVILIFNETCEKMFLCSASFAIGESISKFIPERHRKTHELHVKHFVQTDATVRSYNRQIDMVGLRYNGEEFMIEASIASVEYDTGKRLTVVLKDISERVRAQNEIIRSEEKYRSLFEENISGIILMHPDGTIADCNMQCARMLEYASKTDLIGKNLGNLFQDKYHFELQLLDMLRRKNVYFSKKCLISHSGHEVYVIMNLVGRYDNQGRLIDAIGFMIDNTQFQEMERQFLQAQKMETIGILAGGVAHDFNNILGIILTYTGFLERVASDPEMFKESIGEIVQAVERGSGLVKQILTFARRSDSVFGQINSSILLKETVKMLRETFPKSIEVVLRIDKEIPTINADATQIHQVLLNLAVNARDAMPDGGTLTLSSSVVDGTEIHTRFNDAQPKPYVHICISDTGIGMDESVQMHMFDPFFTTKPKGKGTGLGLSVVYGVIKNHDGFIHAESSPGKGSSFHMYFPIRIQTVSRTTSSEVQTQRNISGSERILIVEDEYPLLNVLKQSLEQNGYRVVTAIDGIEGLELYKMAMEKERDQFDLVFTDLGLPKLAGDKVCTEILKMQPQQKILVASGDLELQKKSHLLSMGVKDVIRKPYTINQIPAKMREIFEADQIVSGVGI